MSLPSVKALGFSSAGRTLVSSVERVALIPRRAECEAIWLPADEGTLEGVLTGATGLGVPEEIVFYCSDCAEREFGGD